MRCEKVREQLSAYLDADLGLLARRRVSAHLHGCDACRREKEALERTVALVRRAGLEVRRPPRDLTAGVMDAIVLLPPPAAPARRTRPLVLVPAGIIAAAVLTVQLTQPPPPKTGVARAVKPNPAYIHEYAEFRANQEIGGGAGMILLASELTEGSR